MLAFLKSTAPFAELPPHNHNRENDGDKHSGDKRDGQANKSHELHHDKQRSCVRPKEQTWGAAQSKAVEGRPSRRLHLFLHAIHDPGSGQELAPSGNRVGRQMSRRGRLRRLIAPAAVRPQVLIGRHTNRLLQLGGEARQNRFDVILPAAGALHDNGFQGNQAELHGS